jgi:hypothetical protein
METVIIHHSSLAPTPLQRDHSADDKAESQVEFGRSLTTLKASSFSAKGARSGAGGIEIAGIVGDGEFARRNHAVNQPG